MPLSDEWVIPSHLRVPAFLGCGQLTAAKAQGGPRDTLTKLPPPDRASMLWRWDAQCVSLCQDHPRKLTLTRTFSLWLGSIPLCIVPWLRTSPPPASASGWLPPSSSQCPSNVLQGARHPRPLPSEASSCQPSLKHHSQDWGRLLWPSQGRLD